MSRLFPWRWSPRLSSPGGVGLEDLRRVLREEIKEALVPLADEIAALTEADTELATEVDAVLTDLAGEPQRVADAVAKALADAGASTAQAEAAFTAATTSTQAIVDKIKAALALPPPPPSALSVSPASITGSVGAALTGTLSVTGGTAPYTFSSDLADVTVDNSGNYSGTPAAAENGTIRVNDSATPPGLFKVPVTIS